MNTDIYVLHKHNLFRLLDRYPVIRSQIMLIADQRYRMARMRESTGERVSTSLGVAVRKENRHLSVSGAYSQLFVEMSSFLAEIRCNVDG